MVRKYSYFELDDTTSGGDTSISSEDIETTEECTECKAIIDGESYYRMGGTVPTNNSCPTGKELEDGLCYFPCPEDYPKGIAFICYSE